MIVDLHGLIEQEAIGQILTALFSLDMGDVDQVEIITGQGIVLRDLAIQEVKAHGYRYYHPNNNLGSIIVYK